MSNDDEYDSSITGMRRGRLCAVCRYPFRGFVAYKMIWCRKDNYYICRKCWQNNCTTRHGDDFTSQGINLVAGGIFVLLLLGITVPFAVVAWHDFGLRSSWEGLPVTEIGSLPDGGTVKVRGVINCTRDVALGGHEAHVSGSGWQWVWEPDTSFRLNDATGSIKVDCSRYYAIAESTRFDTNTTHVDGSIYCNGQETMVIGIVEKEAGQNVIYMRYIAPAGDSVRMDTGLLAWGVFLSAVSALVLLLSAGFALRRRRLHDIAVGEAWPARLPGNLLLKDPKAVWFPMSPIPREMTVRVAGIVLLLLVVLAYAVMIRTTDAHAPADYNALGLAAVCLNTLGAFSVALTIHVSSVPSEIGINDRGILFWHERQSMRLAVRTLLEWDEILLFREPLNMSDDWTIVPKTDPEMPLSGMTLEDTWQFHLEYEKARARYATSFSDVPEDGLTTFHEIIPAGAEETEEDEFVELGPSGETTSFEDLDVESDTTSFEDLEIDRDTTSFEEADSEDGPDEFTERPEMPKFPTIEEPAETVEMDETAPEPFTEFEELPERDVLDK